MANITPSVPLLRPPSPPPGAGISVLSPASYANEERIEKGLDGLCELGFEPRLGPHALERGPIFFAGTPRHRLEDFHEAFVNPHTSLIAAVRGGYGSNYLLPGLNLELIRRHPKPFLAYSDLTAVQLHLLDQIGLPAFHGPMAAADFDREDGVHMPSLLAALAGQPYGVSPAEGMRLIKNVPSRGVVRGTLYGGCLSILVALLGTPWEPQTEGKLLFIEDTGARPHQVDRMIWQLRHAGKLDGVVGLIFGEMLNCSAPGADPELLELAILSALEDLDIPVAFGLQSGHVTGPNVTLTFGVQAELRTTGEPRLELLEPAVLA
jgi:muramoyltetrapeptide carboxypeptidase